MFGSWVLGGLIEGRNQLMDYSHTCVSLVFARLDGFYKEYRIDESCLVKRLAEDQQTSKL